MPTNDESLQIKYSALFNVGFIFGKVDAECEATDAADFYRAVLQHVPKTELDKFTKENAK